MSGRRDDGGPAFPASSWSVNGDFLGENQGMTLRDHFAAAAMQGWIATYRADIAASAVDESCANEAARLAYRVADAMLRERAR